jgi:hypothetical protein
MWENPLAVQVESDGLLWMFGPFSRMPDAVQFVAAARSWFGKHDLGTGDTVRYDESITLHVRRPPVGRTPKA